MQDSKKNPNDLLTISQLADYAHVKRQAVYLAMRKGGFTGIRKKGIYWVLRKDYDEYRLNKYSREKRQLNGEKIYDIPNGKLSTFYVARVMQEELGRIVPLQRIYYLLRQGSLKGHKIGGTWVIMAADAQEFLNTQLEKENRQLKFA